MLDDDVDVQQALREMRRTNDKMLGRVRRLRSSPSGYTVRTLDVDDDRVRRLQGLIVKLFVERFEARERAALHIYSATRAMTLSTLKAAFTKMKPGFAVELARVKHRQQDLQVELASASKALAVSAQQSAADKNRIADLEHEVQTERRKSHDLADAADGAQRDVAALADELASAAHKVDALTAALDKERLNNTTEEHKIHQATTDRCTAYLRQVRQTFRRNDDDDDSDDSDLDDDGYMVKPKLDDDLARREAEGLKRQIDRLLAEMAAKHDADRAAWDHEKRHAVATVVARGEVNRIVETLCLPVTKAAATQSDDRLDFVKNFRLATDLASAQARLDALRSHGIKTLFRSLSDLIDKRLRTAFATWKNLTPLLHPLPPLCLTTSLGTQTTPMIMKTTATISRRRSRFPSLSTLLILALLTVVVVVLHDAPPPVRIH